MNIIDAKGFCIVCLLDPKVFVSLDPKGFFIDLGSKRFSYLWYAKVFRIFLWHPMARPVSVSLDFWRDDQSPSRGIFLRLSYDTPKRWKAALAAFSFSDIIYKT